MLTAVGLRRFYLAQAAIASPSRLCPSHPGSCAAYDAAVNRAILGELHAIFVAAALCAMAGAIAAAALLPTRPAPSVLPVLDGQRE